MANSPNLNLQASYISRSFDVNYLSIYKLHLALTSSGIHFALLNQMNELVLLKYNPNSDNLSIKEHLDKICFSEELLQHKFAFIDILLLADSWQIIPNDFFVNGTEQPYLNTLFSINPESDFYYRDFIRTLSVNLVYATDHLLIKKCQYYFKEYSLKNLITPLLVLHHRLHLKLQLPITINLEVFDKKLLIFVYRYGNLFFANQFQIGTPEDIWYHFLNLTMQLNLPTSDTYAYVTGSGLHRKRAEEFLTEHKVRLVNSRLHIPTLMPYQQPNPFFDEYSYLFGF